MNISQASVEDINDLMELINSAYRGDTSRKGWTTEADLIDGSRVDVETLEQYLNDEDATILKATNEEEVISGCVYLKREAEHLYLGMLTVSPLLQAKGIGKLLLYAAEEYARLWSLEKIAMTVLSARAELISWYERHDYYKTGETKPFHFEEKFGKAKVPLELLVLEKEL